MCTFFVANAYYQIKTDNKKTKPDSDEFHELQRREELGYERAKILRKELLQEAHNKAETLMCKVGEKFQTKSFISIPEISPLENRGGIESRAIFERLDNLIAVMRNQATQISEWRAKTISLLLLTLVDEEETDLQGDEYETSTKQQDEVHSEGHISGILNFTDTVSGICICRRSKGLSSGSSRHSNRPSK